MASELYSRYVNAGNRSPADFGALLTTNAPELVEQYKPYFIQFMKDIRDGNIDYRDYVATGNQEPVKFDFVADRDTSADGSRSKLETTWTPRIKGLTKLEKELMTVPVPKGETTGWAYQNLLTTKFLRAVALEPELPALLEKHSLEEEWEQLVWILPGLMRLRGLVPKNSPIGYRKNWAYEVHPLSHYLAIWD